MGGYYKSFFWALKYYFIITVYSSEFQCIITTPEECYKQSKIQGYEPGNDVNNVEFASSKYATKACYGKIETPKSYFGLGGSLKQYAADASESGSWSSSKLIYKPCLKAGNIFIPG